MKDDDVEMQNDDNGKLIEEGIFAKGKIDFEQSTLSPFYHWCLLQYIDLDE